MPQFNASMDLRVYMTGLGATLRIIIGLGISKPRSSRELDFPENNTDALARAWPSEASMSHDAVQDKTFR